MLVSILFTLMITFSPISDGLIDEIAGVISGEVIESDLAFELGVCTVQQRLNAGWSRYKVLSHYYAPYVKPTLRQLEATRKILNTDYKCPPVYFVFSLQDTNFLFREFDYLYWVCESETKCNIYMSVEQFRKAIRWQYAVSK